MVFTRRNETRAQLMELPLKKSRKRKVVVVIARMLGGSAAAILSPMFEFIFKGLFFVYHLMINHHQSSLLFCK